jgi:DNA-binding NarL/FixJ family response regulator
MHPVAVAGSNWLQSESTWRHPSLNGLSSHKGKQARHIAAIDQARLRGRGDMMKPELEPELAPQPKLTSNAARWTAQEVELLRTWAARGIQLSLIANKLDRTEASVRAKATKLEIKVNHKKIYPSEPTDLVDPNDLEHLIPVRK